MYDLATFPVLETERLILREITLADAQAIFRFRSDPQGQYYNDGYITQLSQAVDLIIEMAQGYRDRTMLEWGLTLKGGDGSVIGICGYANWHHPTRQAEIGYDLLRDYWRQGLGFEALQPIIAFGFKEMNLNRIYAVPWVENIASTAILEKLGFFREGTRRDEYWKDGAFHDEANYSLLQREYRA
jgi:[ribosomal protein S5]-alanine N-acetyltransferase